MVITKQRVGWGLALLAVVLLGSATAASFLLNPGARNAVLLRPAFPLHYSVLVAHIVLAFVALVIGPFQFMKGLRKRYLFLHRITGRVYVSCVVLSGVMGLVVGLFTPDFTRQVAFLTLAVLWLFTVTKAFLAIRRKRIEEHFLWMTRNYALTLVAIVARVLVPLGMLVLVLRGQVSFPRDIERILNDTLGTGIWLSMIINLIVVEWILMRAKSKKAAAKSPMIT
jgi:hypothetical protein